ncbi:hypothetical protein NBO_156g0003 [Nosema bombycis CQ1]|uniref:Uncharacterized protein n=1 Tax=Nosema bombycis (strain CQ1 / CVCC 102059) TaxID=578461 RepID=R0KQY1_NOSB1|nr:hypothetical protein NBO_156g0003 [Nosema bombycis CQ1]|eukprot:EOB13146.1 hypothetical protein NBO_156g0003 [Nosema bombycis CQ1]
MSFYVKNIKNLTFFTYFYYAIPSIYGCRFNKNRKEKLCKVKNRSSKRKRKS